MNSIEAVKARRSVRTYDGNAISTQHLNSIETEILITYPQTQNI